MVLDPTETNKTQIIIRTEEERKRPDRPATAVAKADLPLVYAVAEQRRETVTVDLRTEQKEEAVAAADHRPVPGVK